MGKIKDLSIVYYDCIQVITDWPYEQCQEWVHSHTIEEVEKFILENW